MMHRFAAALLALVFLAVPAVAQTVAERPDFKHFFDEAGTAGTIVVMNVGSGYTSVYNRARAATGYLPASTYKIPNSLIGLETGAVMGVDSELFKWDGVARDFPNWNRDHTLRTAIAASAVPVYQEIARRIGVARMNHFITAMNYGHGTVTAKTLDNFWLEGDFRISANEQIAFLKKLYLNDLPFSQTVINAVKDITTLERGEGYVLHGKTGWIFAEDLGWFVGWVEKGDNAHVFALNMDMSNIDMAAKRISIAKNVFRELGLL